MSKGIIVMDIPEYCDYCPVGRIFGINSGVECLVAPEGQCVSGYGFHVERPDWCSIKPLPKKEKINPYGFCNNRTCTKKERGWNDCIDAILKDGAK